MSRTTVSVRGTARRTVAPDFMTIEAALVAIPAERHTAMSALSDAQRDLTARLDALGGARLTIDTERHDLTWSFGGMQLEDQRADDPSTGVWGPTGRVVGSVPVTIVLRVLDRLSDITDVLTGVERLAIHAVAWRVDDDNPSWRDVRADAIRAALGKAADYAAALGGAVTHVQHVADAGLLTGSAERAGSVAYEAQSWSSRASGVAHDAGRVPVLDPVPQRIKAVVDARALVEVPDLEPTPGPSN